MILKSTVRHASAGLAALALLLFAATALAGAASQSSGNLTIDCPPEQGPACPGDTVYYTYHACSNSLFLNYVIFEYTNGTGGCTYTDSTFLAAGDCRDLNYVCKIPRCYLGPDTTLVGRFWLSESPDSVITCAVHFQLKRNNVQITDRLCPADRVVQPGDGLDLGWNLCVAGTAVCRDSIYCDLYDTQGWLTNGSQHMEGLLLGCHPSAAHVDVPPDAVPGDSDEVFMVCTNTCGTLVDTCRTVLRCMAVTPVAISDVELAAAHRYVELSWSSPLQGASQFQVVRSGARNGAFQPVAFEIGAGSAGRYELRDASVRPGTEYWYKVGVGSGAAMNWTSALRVRTLAATLALDAPRPNPARGIIRLDYELDRPGEARLEVFDATGRKIRTLMSGAQETGPGSAVWDRKNDGGGRTAAGIYFVKLTARGGSRSQRVLVLE
jgi:hypothetical protein